MEYILLFILIIVVLYFNSQIKKLQRQAIITSTLLKATIWALYDKRGDEIKNRLLEIEEIREAVKVATVQKLPEKDTPMEEFLEIFGPEMKDKQRHLCHSMTREMLSKKYQK